MFKKHDAWHGAMVWPHHALVKVWEGLAYVVMHALHKLNHRRGSSVLSRGKSSKLKGNPNFLCSLPWSFFLRRTYTLQITLFKFGIFSGSFTIFVGWCAFSRHLAHINAIQLQLHGCDVTHVDCCLIAVHPMVHTRSAWLGFWPIITQHAIASAHTISRSDGDEPCAIMNEQNCKGSPIYFVVCHSALQNHHPVRPPSPSVPELSPSIIHGSAVHNNW